MMEQRSHDTFTGAIFQVFLQVGKGKNIILQTTKSENYWVFYKKNTQFYVSKIENSLFVENFRGLEWISGESSLPLPYEKKPCI